MTTRAAQIELLVDPLTDPNTGALCSGYSVEFYSAGTSNAKNVWTEKEKSNPFTTYSLDSGAKALLYGDGIYKIIVKNIDGTVVLTLDNQKIKANNFSVRTLVGTATATPDDDALLCDGTFTVNLQDVANFEHPIEIVNTGAGTITVDPFSTQTIESSATLALGAGERARLTPDVAANVWRWIDFITDVAAHAASTGTAVHGLGTMSTNSIGALANSIIPNADNSIDLGSAGKEFKDIYIDGTANLDAIITDGITINSVAQGKDVTVAIHRKIVEIGDWNMDSTVGVNVAHGLTLAKIRSVSVIIRNDADNNYCDLIGGVTVVAGYFNIDGTNVNLYRVAGVGFDGVTYDSTSFNRGWMTIDYVD